MKPEAPLVPPKHWTILVYLAGATDLSDEARDSLLAMKQIGSTEDFNVIAQFDSGSEGRETKRYYLRPLGANKAERVRKLLRALETGSLKNEFEKCLGGKSSLEKLLTCSCLPRGRSLGDFLDMVFDPGSQPKKHLYSQLQNKKTLTKLTKNPELIKTLVLSRILDDDRVPPNPGKNGNTDAGNPKVLREFVEWGHEYFPSDHSLLIIWGHGDGFSVAWDATPHSRFISGGLTVAELKAALLRRPPPPGLCPGHNPLVQVVDNGDLPIDIVGFDSCQMAMLEVYHRLSDIARLVVGSEGFIPTRSWPYRRVLNALRKQPLMEPATLANTVVKEFVNQYKVSADISLCRLSSVEHLKEALFVLARLLLRISASEDPRRLEDRQRLIAARLDTQSYNDDYVDLVDFCDQLSKRFPDRKQIPAACKKVKESIRAMVLKRNREAKVSHGVSVYFPLHKISRRYNHLEIGLKVGNQKQANLQANWRDLLDSFRKLTQAMRL
jgi:hypothetical protein